jgi:hypothetical protein
LTLEQNSSTFFVAKNDEAVDDEDVDDEDVDDEDVDDEDVRRRTSCCGYHRAAAATQ